MRRLIFIAVLLVLATQGLVAQKTIVEGTAPGAEGKSVVLGKFRDLVTFEEMNLDSAVIDSTGKFSLACNLSEPVYVSVSIDFHKMEMFLEPGKKYGLNIAPQDFNSSREINPLLLSQNLQAEIRTDLNDLNIQVNEFNAMYDQFVLSNFEALYRDRNKSKLDSFRVKTDKQFESVTSPYFRAYVRYKLAGIEQLTQALTQSQLAKKYFNGQPLLYENLEYMDFFNSFFSKYLTVTSRILHKIDYLPLLKSPDAYEKLMKVMAQDTLVRDESLRELVLLKGLMEMFNTTGYNQEEVILVIRSIQAKSKVPEHRMIAVDMEKRLMNLKPGTEAPGFTLSDIRDKKVSLKSLRGKPVLLCFWTTYCPTCLTQLDLMKTLYDKFSDRMWFVSISADRDFIKMKYFLEQKKEYTWYFLHLGNQYGLLKDYDVRSFPLFVLIDREGLIYRYPAEFPDKGLEAAMEKMFQ
jgi:peroxiredoxin